MCGLPGMHKQMPPHVQYAVSAQTICYSNCIMEWNYNQFISILIMMNFPDSLISATRSNIEHRYSCKIPPHERDIVCNV